ncbi:hypothetical protein WDW86_10200 [Bdellovibrionota bacterium FG-2]
METTKNENAKPETSKTASKQKIKVGTDSLRVKKETKKRVLSEIASLNKKDYGRVITPDDLVAKAISLLRPEHLEDIKAQALSNKDRLEMRYQEYCAKNGKVSKDEFYGVLLSAGTEITAES